MLESQSFRNRSFASPPPVSVTTTVPRINTSASHQDDVRIGVAVCDALDVSTRRDGLALDVLPVSYRGIVSRVFTEIAEKRRELAM